MHFRVRRHWKVGILLLTGSLLNHSDAPNVDRVWDSTSEQEVFTTIRDIKQGEELVHNYQHGSDAAGRL